VSVLFALVCPGIIASTESACQQTYLCEEKYRLCQSALVITI